MPLRDMIPPDWAAALAPALASVEAAHLAQFLRAEAAAGKVIYPPEAERFAALALTPLDRVKVVILGQDPYHGPGQAHGLAFSVRDGIRLPPSLRNIYKELQADLGIPPATQGNLTAWTRQGVLLLNNALSVEQGRAGSHQKRGWEAITDAAIAAVAAQAQPCVFILWGAHAQAKAARIPGLHEGRHLVLSAPHPSPLSAYAGFFGSRPFSQANAFLTAQGRGAIDWQIEPRLL
jgi:uracil-DNA glycosylase